MILQKNMQDNDNIVLQWWHPARRNRQKGKTDN
jgi:hypothetical protein